WGATEVKVPDLVDAIVEGTETGSTLRAHRLKILDTLLESTPRWIANRESYADEWKRQKMENIILLLRGALEAEGMVGLKMNVSRESLQAVIGLLPAMKRPTISALADEHWVAVETILPETTARDLIPQLKRAGAEGFVEYPLLKVIP
ncbi:MAG TPA: ATP phosphoribosyltransferase, partial [Armatimonadota bacterium]|nr:ATP phosphoribosyltransferase [Armatimonadota bacterium]